MTEFSWHVLTAVLAAVVLVQTLVLVGALRHIGGLLLKAGPDRYGDVDEGPAIGTVVDVSMIASVPAFVLFVSEACSLCKPIVARLPAVRRQYREIAVVPVAIGDLGPGKRAFVGSLGEFARADLDSLYAEWQVPGTPFGVTIGKDHSIVGRGVVNSVGQVESLMDELVHPHVHEPHDHNQDGEPLPLLNPVAVGVGAADDLELRPLQDERR